MPLGKMLDHYARRPYIAVLRLINDIRMSWDYRAYETAERLEWIANAERMHSADGIALERSLLVAKLEADAHNAFGYSIANHTRTRNRLASELGEQKSKLSLFETHYKSELEAAYADLSDFKTNMARVRSALNDAYRDAKEAHANVERWYRKSKRTPLLLGNARRRLPEFDPFGQSFGDLHSFKADREEASRRIAELKRRRDSLHASRESIVERIQDLKSQRQQFFDLRRQGISAASLHRSVSELQRRLASEERAIRLLEQRQAEYLSEEKVRRGITSLGQQIAKIHLLRRDQIARFNEPAEVRARRARHREQWLQRHAPGS